MFTSAALRNRLTNAPAWALALYAAIAAFGVYFCMYAFRKPFTAAGYEGLNYFGIDYKVWLVTAQVIGYTLSKFYGIRFISSMKGDKRAGSIVKLILISWLTLLPFALVPAPYNIFFYSSMACRLAWCGDLCFSFLEGRKTTEFMGAVLSISFIFHRVWLKRLVNPY